MILVVDDDPQMRRVLTRVLEGAEHECMAVETVADARTAMRDPACQLVLCDVMMPGESGFDLVREARRERPDLPIVMISAVTDVSLATLALELGAYGYVTKPFEPNQVLIAVANALRRAELEAENRTYRNHLEAMVEARTRALREAEQQVRDASEEMVSTLAQAIEGRDIETGNHILRMSHYTALLARHAGLDAERVEQLRLASPMHDVGKIGIADGILFKPGSLTPAERAVVEQHADIGHRILAKSEQPLLQLAATIARTHHERWDGTGYPLGLAGEQIPFEGRIVAIADVFDALVSPRVYKPAFEIDHALSIMREGRATHFDPELLDLFLDRFDEVEAIRNLLRDP